MYKNIIVRRPSTAIVNALTTSNVGTPIYTKALAQHEAYVKILQECKVAVTVLPPDERFPDSVFVEDPVLCTPRCAILTRPGAESRRNETALMEDIIKNFYSNVERIVEPGTLDAGDVMMVRDHYYIGLSTRTNLDGGRQLIDILNKYGMTGSLIPLEKMFHLKTGVAYLENDNLLISGELIDRPEFEKFNKIRISDDEAYAANCIWVNGKVIMPAGYSAIQDKISALGYTVATVDTSEFQKVDGGVSCLSLRF